MAAIVRLYYPADPFGRLICWRLESAFSHATIELDGTLYSATFPRIVGVGPTDRSFGMPPRTGQSYAIRLTDEETAKAVMYCQSMLGTSYDVLAMFGWAFRIQSMQRPGHAYCFEYVYDALAAAGVFASSRRLVTGDQLLADLYAAGRVENLTTCIGTERLASHQKPAVVVPAPKVNP
ncbi:C40 family peptidase [Gluconobacter morbifer]|uniref:Uncharacterized protein n=1 Tax=Gluconobacter morbifer G707 TaxID=1088869 RepID=G6XMS3_9PROT|nr:hypothetical protein [Gluconobacter morbifer]EHH66972.1 hypothetical protein GMO_27910 [Gluconobacter morbifer G707]